MARSVRAVHFGVVNVDSQGLVVWSEVLAQFVEEHWMWLLATVMLLISLSLLRQISLGLKSRYWPSTRGIVTRSYIQKDHDHEDGTAMYSARVAYRYEVGGRRYRGSRIQFGRDGLSSSWSSGERRLIEEFPEGKRISVLHHPAKPRLSALIPGASAWAWVFLLMFLAAAGFFLWRAWLKM